MFRNIPRLIHNDCFLAFESSDLPSTAQGIALTVQQWWTSYNHVRLLQTLELSGISYAWHTPLVTIYRAITNDIIDWPGNDNIPLVCHNEYLLSTALHQYGLQDGYTRTSPGSQSEGSRNVADSNQSASVVTATTWSHWGRDQKWAMIVR